MPSLKRYKKSLLALADAIVRGSKKRKQTTGTFFTARPTQGVPPLSYVLDKSCALGAAYEGAFGAPPVLSDGKVDGGDRTMTKRLNKRFKVLTKPALFTNENGDTFTQSVSTYIVELNDDALWTRGHIARWLRRLAAA